MNDTREAMYKQRIREMERSVSQLKRVIKLAQVLNSTLELYPLLDMITQVATEMIVTDSASIMLIDKKSGELRFVAAHGQKSAEIKPFAVPMKGSIAGMVATTNLPVLIADAQNDARWYQGVDEGTGYVTRSIVAVPLAVRGRVIGVVEAVNKLNDAEMTEEDVEILTTLANQAAIAIENARLLAELQVAYDELNEFDQMKRDFIAIAAHELRTPLSVILGYAMFLKDDASGVAGEQLDIVLDSAMRLRSLIDDMVNLREVDVGEAALELERFSIQDLVTTMVEEIRSLAEAKEQRLSLGLLEEPIIVEADRKKLNIVLINLLSNAVKFTDNKGRLGVQIGRDKDYAWFTVWDTGIGIPRDKISRIFERFYQVEPSLARRYEGMGLGLAIAKEMVELHNGHIRVVSQEEKGSAFTVTIPMRQVTRSS